jgi:hypothetical protein
MLRFAIGDLPEGALDAADHFHAEWLPMLRHHLDVGSDIALVFPPADHSHNEWRRAVVAGLAREYAPARANAISGDDGEAIEAALEYLVHSPAITGQLLAVDGKPGKTR